MRPKSAATTLYTPMVAVGKYIMNGRGDVLGRMRDIRIALIVVDLANAGAASAQALRHIEINEPWT